MLIQSPALTTQFASLHTALRAQGTCVWIPASIHTIIMACLARIFGRLEQLLLLWQSGELPLLAVQNPGPTGAARPPVPGMPRPPIPARARHAGRQAPIREPSARVALPRSTAVIRARHPAPGTNPSRTRTPFARPHLAHDPPANPSKPCSPSSTTASI